MTFAKTHGDGTLRLARHRARPTPPGLTARRSCPGAAARNMVSAPVCLTATSVFQQPTAECSWAASASHYNARETRERERERLRQEHEFTVSVCPLGSRAANGDGGKLGTRLGSRAKVRRSSERPRLKCGGRMPGGAGELQITVAQKASPLHSGHRGYRELSPWDADVTFLASRPSHSKSFARSFVRTYQRYTCNVLNTISRSGDYNKRMHEMLTSADSEGNNSSFMERGFCQTVAI